MALRGLKEGGDMRFLFTAWALLICLVWNLPDSIVWVVTPPVWFQIMLGLSIKLLAINQTLTFIEKFRKYLIA